MATNPPKGPGRKGAVRTRTQFTNPTTGLAVKRDKTTGRIMDNKTTGGKFKGVTKEKKARATPRTTKRATARTTTRKRKAG
jgi:hypothetical protein